VRDYGITVDTANRVCLCQLRVSGVSRRARDGGSSGERRPANHALQAIAGLVAPVEARSELAGVEAPSAF